MSKTYEYIHMVFGTKNRMATISPGQKEHLIAYMYTLLKDKECFVYRINAMPDHIHLFFDKSPKLLISDTAKFLKAASSKWMKDSGRFPSFQGWAREYFAGTISPWDKNMIIDYIAKQEFHHREMSLMEEMKRLYKSAGFSWHDNDFM